MISAAIQSTLSAIITDTYIAITDEKTEAPFCVHEERETPERLKEGIVGYEYECEIAIVASLPDTVETYKQTIITAIEALAGTTISGTKIDEIEYQGDEPGFNQEDKTYLTILRFLIETSNR